MRLFLAVVAFQTHVLRRDPADLLVLVTVPLMTAGFLGMFLHAGQPRLVPYAIIAPAVIGQWQMALQVCGDVVSRDRWAGTLELLVAAPVSLARVIFTRVLCVVVLSLVSVGESLAVAEFGFHVDVTIPHPGWFAVTLVATTAGLAGVATTMAAAFVLTRTARIFQNTLAYPFYILGGVIVPVALLPDWLAGLSHGFFLSWATDLLRDSLAAAPVPNPVARLAAVALLGACWYGVAFGLLAVVLRRVRGNGEVSVA